MPDCERMVVVVGGGGHAACLLDCVSGAGITLEGYVATERGRLSDEHLEYLGGDDVAAALYGRGVRFALLGVAGARDNDRRRRVFDLWRHVGFQFIDAVHPSAILSPRAARGEGLQCLAGAIVNGGACIGVNVLLNTGAIVEHDCRIGDHAHVGPGAILAGGVTVGEGALIGAGAVVVPGISIGAGALVAAGSVVTRVVPDRARVAGMPARPMRGDR